MIWNRELMVWSRKFIVWSRDLEPIGCTIRSREFVIWSRAFMIWSRKFKAHRWSVSPAASMINITIVINII